MKTASETRKDGLFIRLLLGIGTGCLAGVLGGAVSGTIGSFMFWALSRIFSQGLHVLPIDLMEFIPIELTIYGIPVGFIVGLTTGLHHAVFHTLKLRWFIWATLACLGTVLGLWLSNLTDRQPDFIIRLAFYVEVACIGSITAWIAHRFTMVRPAGLNNMVRRELIILSLASGLLSIFGATYYYFALMNYLQNIPS